MRRIRIHGAPLSFLSGLLILGCLFKAEETGGIAGTSISTGNPSSIRLDFQEGGLPARFTGKVEIFGATQVPLPDLQPRALCTLAVADADSFTLEPGPLDAIPDSAWPSTSWIGDSLIRFNAVVSDGKRAAIVRGFQFHTGLGRIDWVDSTGAAPASAAARRRGVPLTALVRFTAKAEVNVDPSDDHYMFITGTGYIAVGDSSGTRFPFEAIPSGSHRFQWISIWKPGMGPASRSDSIYALNTLAPIGTDGNGEVTLDPEGYFIPVPKLYRAGLLPP